MKNFEDIIGCSLTASQLTQAALPLRVGGCGLRCPQMQRPAARISALAAFHRSGARSVGVPEYAQQVTWSGARQVMQELQGFLGPNFDPLTTWVGNPELLATADLQHCRQQWWAERLGKKRMHSLLDAVSPRDQNRLLEQATGLGSCFMAVTPSVPLHTNIPSDTYRMALKWWLGVPIIEHDPQNPPTCPGCRASVDPHGDHFLCCPRNNYTRRHQAMQEALAGVLSEAGQPFEREVVIPNCSDTQLRPADLLLKNWMAGKDTAVDLTVSHGWQATMRASAATDATREKWRSFLVNREKLKKQKYMGHCRIAGWSFLPMAFGTWGGMGPDAAKLLFRFLKRAASWLDGDARAARQEELRLNVGLALMRHIWVLLEAKNAIY